MPLARPLNPLLVTVKLFHIRFEALPSSPVIFPYINPIVFSLSKWSICWTPNFATSRKGSVSRNHSPLRWREFMVVNRQLVITPKRCNRQSIVRLECSGEQHEGGSNVRIPSTLGHLCGIVVIKQSKRNVENIVSFDLNFRNAI
jgi:hypothetical protein